MRASELEGTACLQCGGDLIDITTKDDTVYQLTCSWCGAREAGESIRYTRPRSLEADVQAARDRIIDGPGNGRYVGPGR